MNGGIEWNQPFDKKDKLTIAHGFVTKTFQNQ